LAVALLVLLSAGCSSPNYPVPDVAGLQLDDAHNVLKAAGFDRFEDVDLLENREADLESIFEGDSSWAVIKQDPVGDSLTDQDRTIRLEVLNKRDVDIAARLPTTSPVLQEIKQRDAERAAEAAAKAEAEKAKADRPLDCREPTLELVSESWEIEETRPTTFGRSLVKAVITNASEHKIASAGIVFTTAWRDRSGKIRSTNEYGGYGLAVDLVPNQSIGLAEWTTVGPGESWEVSRDFANGAAWQYETDGTEPWMDELFVNWHFENPDLERACEEAK
jgi:hypothetical protein